MKLALDTNIFMYYLENNAEFGSAAKRIFAAISSDEHVSASSSTLVIAELLSGQHIGADEDRVISAFLRDSSVQFQDISEDILRSAAKMRRINASYKLPDAIHIASAEGCDVFVTNDAWLCKQKPASIKIMGLEQAANLVEG